MSVDRLKGWDGAVEESKLLLKKMSDEEILVLAGGLVAMQVYEKRLLDEVSFGVYVQASVDSGRLSREQLTAVANLFGHWDERLDVSRALEGDIFEDAKELSQRDDLGSVGFVHGHYRRLTLGHMFSFIEAARRCDTLVVK